MVEAITPDQTTSGIACNWFNILTGASKFSHKGFEEVRGGVAGGGELRFHLVHQGHQLIHFGHDPALLGEGWKREDIAPQSTNSNKGLDPAAGVCPHLPRCQ